MPLYTDVCRTQCQCDVTLDTTIPETLANYTPVLRDCECHNCAVNQSQAVTGSSIDQSDSVFDMSNTFSDESIDVVFEEPDTPSLQSVDIMPSQSYFEMTESILFSDLSMELARNIPYSTCSYNDNDSIWVPLESSVEVPSAVNVQSFYSDNQNDFSFPQLTEDDVGEALVLPSINLEWDSQVLSETEIISTHFNSGSMSDSQLSTNSRYDNNESQVLSGSRESVEHTCSHSDAETQWPTDSQGAPLPRLIMVQNLGESSDSDLFSHSVSILKRRK